MKRLTLLILAIWSAVASAQQMQIGPCFWSGQLTKCYPSTGLYLDTQRTLRLGDATTNYVELQAPAAVTSYTLVMPASQGGVTTIPQNDGSGNLTWVAKPTGTVTSVGLTAAGGIFAATPAAITTSGTFVESVAGTSGGVPYFSSSTQLSSSGLLAANGVVLGGGAAATPATTAAGTSAQVLRVPDAGGAPAFGAVNLASGSAVTGLLAVANGGTHLASGTSGGILGYTATGTIASSALLQANAVVLGGGAGATPVATATGAATTVLVGGGAGAPSFGNVPAAALPAASSSAAGSVSYEDSGTFTATFTGPCSSGTITITYTRVGKLVQLSMPAWNCSCTVATHFTAATSLPAALRPVTTPHLSTISIEDNAATNKSGQFYVDSSGNIAIFNGLGEGNFTGSTTACGPAVDTTDLTYSVK